MKREIDIDSAEHQQTVARLLDTAERLFGEHGYDGVGMRMLASEAQVNLGAATYHFGSKEVLYTETFMRRFRPMNAARVELLRKAIAAAKGAPISVETIVDCMLRPPFESGIQHPAFHRFLARNLGTPPPFILEAIYHEVAPGMEEFIAAFRRALPDVPEDLLHLRAMFSMGSL